MKRLLMTGATLAVCACSPAALLGCSKPEDKPEGKIVEKYLNGKTNDGSISFDDETPAHSIEGIPAGDYKTDPSHTALTFTVSHLGYSHYTAQFGKIDAQLKLDPAHPEQAALTVEIDPLSLDLPAPPKGFHDELMGKAWFDTKAFTKITFVSSKIETTGTNTAKVTGDLTLHGVTKPVTLDVTFNGGYAGMAGYDPNARIGFSANGTLKRSDFGIAYGIPAPGTTMGVSDAVDFRIETEMTGPALKTS